jgi:hypothetical protein
MVPIAVSAAAVAARTHKTSVPSTSAKVHSRSALILTAGAGTTADMKG